MGLLEEADAGADFVGDSPAGQLHLNIHGMEMGPVKDGHFRKGNAVPMKLEDPLGDEVGLLQGIPGGDDHRPHPGFADGPQGFGKLIFVVDDAEVRQVQNFRSAAIIGLQLENPAVRILFREGHDIGVIGSPEGVDALGVVSHHHDVAVPGSQQIHDLRLEKIGVLVFVHQEMLKPFAVTLQDVGTFHQQPAPVEEEIVEIHQRGLAFAQIIESGHLPDLFPPVTEKGIALL
ncbi:MAG: hypothetical protein A4E70_01866 [Syntrophus sp. PtaU1.Bin005]|nr:MAG: hypothetical protein A4E70_01866 [Syntrophus sp. PtaU1.Bin005]